MLGYGGVKYGEVWCGYGIVKLRNVPAMYRVLLRGNGAALRSQVR